MTATIKIIRPDGETDDYFDIQLNYEDKRVILKASLMVFQNDLRYIIHGNKGSFFKSGLDVQEETPVSYTHLDVYKRQDIFIHNRKRRTLNVIQYPHDLS